MFSFLFKGFLNNLLPISLATMLALALYSRSGYKDENYKLHTKIKQMEAVLNECQSEKDTYRLYCATKEDILNTGVEDVILEDNDTNNSIIFDFSKLQ